MPKHEHYPGTLLFLHHNKWRKLFLHSDPQKFCGADHFFGVDVVWSHFGTHLFLDEGSARQMHEEEPHSSYARLSPDEPFESFKPLYEHIRSCLQEFIAIEEGVLQSSLIVRPRDGIQYDETGQWRLRLGIHRDTSHGFNDVVVYRQFHDPTFGLQGIEDCLECASLWAQNYREMGGKVWVAEAIAQDDESYLLAV